MKNHNLFILMLMGWLFASPVLSSDTTYGDETGLCHDGEQVLFSCGIGSKYVSVCASGELAPDSGHLSYRFGSLNAAPELEYPDTTVAPGDAFSFAYKPYAKGNFIQLSFERGEYRYTVDVQSHVFRSNWSGVVVEYAGKIIAKLECNTQQRGFKLIELEGLGFTVHSPRDLGTSIK